MTRSRFRGEELLVDNYVRTLAKKWLVPAVERERIGMYSHMFLDDVRANVAPIYGRERWLKELTENERPDILSFAFGSRDSWASDRLESALGKWISDFAYYICVFGYARYEIAWLRSRRDSASKQGFVVLPATREQIFSIGNVRLGCVVRDSHGQKLKRPRAVRIPSSRLIQASLPFKLRSLPRIVDNLARLSVKSFPEFAIPDANSKRVPFDASLYQSREYEALAACTSIVGWNARALLPPRETLFYALERDIRFHEFLFTLCELAIRTANEAIAIAELELGPLGRIAPRDQKDRTRFFDARDLLWAGRSQAEIQAIYRRDS